MIISNIILMILLGSVEDTRHKRSNFTDKGVRDEY